MSDFTGAFNDDLDTNDDGILDATPWTSVIDGVGMVNRSSGSFGANFVYGAALGFVDIGPDADPIQLIFRDPNETGQWVIGSGPFGDVDTPGVSNAPVPLPGGLLPLITAALAVPVLRFRQLDISQTIDQTG